MIDLREGCHGGTGACVADALLNGHGRRKTGNQIDFRPFENGHVLPDIGGKAFKITPLTFRKEHVKCQGGLA